MCRGRGDVRGGVGRICGAWQGWLVRHDCSLSTQSCLYCHDLLPGLHWFTFQRRLCQNDSINARLVLSLGVTFGFMMSLTWRSAIPSSKTSRSTSVLGSASRWIYDSTGDVRSSNTPAQGSSLEIFSPSTPWWCDLDQFAGSCDTESDRSNGQVGLRLSRWLPRVVVTVARGRLSLSIKRLKDLKRCISQVEGFDFAPGEKLRRWLVSRQVWPGGCGQCGCIDTYGQVGM